MKEQDSGWFINLMQIFPELPGIILLLFGIVVWYWSTRGNEWLYDTGGPEVFTSITWIRSTFGEAIARRLNTIVSWGIIFSGIGLLTLGLWLRLVVLHGK